MSNPLDEYMEMRKEAGFGQLIRGFGQGLVGLSKKMPVPPVPLSPSAMGAAEKGYQLGQTAQTGAALAAGGALLTGAAGAYKKIHESIQKKQDFKQMMAVDPELSQLQKERPKFFNQAYSSLRNINPTFGSDPLVAGSYMRKMMSNPDAAGLTIAQSVKAPQVQGAAMRYAKDIGPFKIGF